VTEGSAFRDRRVRRALNYAIDRDELVKFLNGTAKPAYGLYPPENPYFGKPEERYRHDPEKARALLAEAGYGPDHPLNAKVMISTPGSGQMVPLPINEILQQQVQPVGFKLDFDVVDGAPCSRSSEPPAQSWYQEHRDLGPADAVSVGIYLQTLMLALTARGLGTCVEVSAAGYPDVVRTELNIPPELTFICGLAVGDPDPDFPANKLHIGRDPVAKHVVFLDN
jgi:Bacterial extracellular solute-binding proteins, family 5 Middle/Nitroreductase family